MLRSHLMSDSKTITLLEFFPLSKTMKALQNIFITNWTLLNTCHSSTQSFRSVILNQRQYFPPRGLFAMSEDVFNCHTEGKRCYWHLTMHERALPCYAGQLSYLPSCFYWFTRHTYTGYLIWGELMVNKTQLQT